MSDVTESLMMLCEQALIEQDTEKLSNLVEEIIRLLAEKQRLEELETLRDVSRPTLVQIRILICERKEAEHLLA